ncbi:MAG: DUF1611 domain-containing protein [Cyclobacteriaceae bacterium]
MTFPDGIYGDAIVLSGGMLESRSAKTTHGLVRGSQRFDIKAVIDSQFGGKQADEIIPKGQSGIPIELNVSDFLAKGGQAKFCVIGVATKGGVLPDAMKIDVIDAINGGISIVNGLHKFLNDDEEIAKLAAEKGVQVHDVRKPRPKNELQFWTGEIYKIKTPKIAVIGTDCGLGKRTTAKFLIDSLRSHGHSAEMIYTGQTGWLQGWRYGFILDSTVNDFVSGELEVAMLRCAKEVNPEFMIIEGQAALRNISGPCGAEFLISGNTDAVILHHSPIRKYYHGYDHLGIEIPPLIKEKELVEAYGRKVIGATLNTVGIDYNAAKKFQAEYENELNVPVALPFEEGVEKLIPAIKSLT